MNNYKILSQEKVICPYCCKPQTLFNVTRHLKSKSCQKYKEKYMKVNPDTKEETFELYVNELRQNALHKDLMDD